MVASLDAAMRSGDRRSDYGRSATAFQTIKSIAEAIATTDMPALI
jgi:hypothetical protein